MSGEDLIIQHLTNGDAVTMICGFGCASSQRFDILEFTDGQISREQVALFADTDERNTARNTGLFVGSWYNSNFFHDIGDGSYTLQDRDGYDVLTFTDSPRASWNFSTDGSNWTATHIDGEVITFPNGFVNNRDGRRGRLDGVVFTDASFLDIEVFSSMVADDMKSSGTVIGVSYNTTFEHTLGDGSYTIRDLGGSDNLVFSDSDVADWVVSQAGVDLIIEHATNGERITIVDYYLLDRGSRVNAIELFVFEDATMTSIQMDAAAL